MVSVHWPTFVVEVSKLKPIGLLAAPLVSVNAL